MCGICGIVYNDPARPVEKALLHQMSRALRHRGPDDSEVRVLGQAGLAHTRLAVIDPGPRARQPMPNEDSTIWLAANGEIYNFKELRKGLEQKGHVFRSATDSEVILHLFEEKGTRCVEDLQGMFAFAVWNDKDQSLFLARDRMGKKPLYYAELPGRFLFASEIKAFWKIPNSVSSRTLPPSTNIWPTRA